MMGRATLTRAALHRACEEGEQLKVFAKLNNYTGNREALEALKRNSGAAQKFGRFGAARGRASTRRRLWPSEANEGASVFDLGRLKSKFRATLDSFFGNLISSIFRLKLICRLQDGGVAAG